MLLPSRLHCLLCLLLCMRQTLTALYFQLWALSKFVTLTLTEYVFWKDDWFFFGGGKISPHYSVLRTVVGWREAAGCLLHLPRDVRQVLLYTTAPQWSSSLLHGSEQVGGGWRGSSRGPRQGEVTLKCFTLHYSVEVLCSFLVDPHPSWWNLSWNAAKNTISNEYRNDMMTMTVSL